MSDIQVLEDMLKRAGIKYDKEDDGGALAVSCKYELDSGPGVAVVEFDEDGDFVVADWVSTEDDGCSTGIAKVYENWTPWNSCPSIFKTSEFNQICEMLEESDEGETEILESNDGQFWGVLYVPFDGEGFVIFGFKKSDEKLDHVVGALQ